MKTLLLFRGSSGAGKSTTIKELGLLPFTISVDGLRLIHQSFSLAKNGNFEISNKAEKTVWKCLEDILRKRMEKGVFTIVDSTNYKISHFKRYKKLANEYGYEIITVDMTDVSIEECKKRNLSREQYKQVDEDVITRMYKQFENKTPDSMNPIKEHEIKDNITIKPIDLSNYKKVNIIGDIHGCYTVLDKYLEDGIKENEFYIFCGDYIDRGIENAQIIKFIFENYLKKNVVFLEGNHEKWLKMWSENKETKSSEFEKYTKIQLHKNNISQKQTKMFCEKIKQLMYFTYNEKTFIVTHGGLSTLPDNLMMVSTEEIIRGVGVHTDDIDNIFTKNVKGEIYQVHGHRNEHLLPILATKNSFNLEGQVEMGGYLRILEITNSGFKDVKIKNHVYNKIRF